MRKLGKFLVLVLAVLFVLFALSGPLDSQPQAQETPVPMHSGIPENSAVVYTEDKDLFVMDLLTMEVAQLTATPELDEQNAVWSPDGSKIAYIASTPENLQVRELHVMDLEYPEQSYMVHECFSASCWYPLWSPDGTRISFIRLDFSRGHTYGEWLLYDTTTGESQVLLEGDVFIDIAPGDWLQERLVVRYNDADQNNRYVVFEQDGTLHSSGALSEVPDQFDVEWYRAYELVAISYQVIQCSEVPDVPECFEIENVLTVAQQVSRADGEMSMIYLNPDW